MASQTQGIHQMLSAEKKATKMAAEARKPKEKRLKQTKDEATEEIEKFREESERAFNRSGYARQIGRDISSRKEPVILEILNYVYNIQHEEHKTSTRKCKSIKSAS